MLKYLSKFAMDILPSVVATIIGAYIVNHYINAKPAPEAPATAAIAPVVPKKKPEVKSDTAALQTAPDAANTLAPGVRAKGISERAILEKTAAEKPVVVEKPVEKSADKPTETASIPVEAKRPQPAPAPREKTVAKSVVPPSAPTAAPVVAAPITVGSVEAVAVPEERRDATDLARAAIDRLRGTAETTPRPQESARAPEISRVASVPPVPTPPVRPLPPPIMVSTPAPEAYGAGPSQLPAPYAAAPRTDDPQRPIPPADIPTARPLDLRAEAVNPAPPTKEHTTVAEDVLSAAKSVFHAVLPK